MGLIIILPLFIVSCWGIFAIQQWLRSGAYGPEWWRAFGILACVGACLGLFFAFVIHYQIANAQIDGFPIPVALSNREKPGEPWHASDMPAFISNAAKLTDTLFGVALCLTPIAAAAFIKENRGKLVNETPPPSAPQS